jgi:tRNA(Ile)-lysidine synthase
MDLLRSFRDFIDKEALFSPQDKLLLAVSGGLDSIVLCELCHQAGFEFAIAHCNFQLRGEESERDEQFVTALAARYQKELLIRRFDTTAYATGQKLSIQEAARDLRYGWFREILTDWQQQMVIPRARCWLVAAHHLDDNIETLLMNFFKGTGIAGLKAIQPRQGKIVRPLLFAGKTELSQFALDHQLSWVEDSSNISDKYTRNFFRHQVIPLIQQRFPGAMQNLAGNITRFREIETLYETHIPVLKLKKTSPLSTLVYEIIQPFGFSPQQVNEVIALLDGGSGRYITSASHRILRNRDWLIISPLQPAGSGHILITTSQGQLDYGDGSLKWELLPVSAIPFTLSEPQAGTNAPSRSDAQVRPDPQPTSRPQPQSRKSQAPVFDPVAWLDADAIQFPLLLRKWRQGDYFYPLGMKKKKKLARFFIDSKLSLSDKEKVWVIEMNKKIIWIVGLRIDDRFRVSPHTRNVLKMESGLA